MLSEHRVGCFYFGVTTLTLGVGCDTVQFLDQA